MVSTGGGVKHVCVRLTLKVGAIQRHADAPASERNVVVEVDVLFLAVVAQLGVGGCGAVHDGDTGVLNVVQLVEEQVERETSGGGTSGEERVSQCQTMPTLGEGCCLRLCHKWGINRSGVGTTEQKVVAARPLQTSLVTCTVNLNLLTLITCGL